MTAQEPLPLSVLLDQQLIWQKRDGNRLVTVRLDEMDATHLMRLRAWLLRNAGQIQNGILYSLTQAGNFFHGEAAQDTIDREWDRVASPGSIAWMKDQILFETIDERLCALLHETPERLAELLDPPPETNHV